MKYFTYQNILRKIKNYKNFVPVYLKTILHCVYISSLLMMTLQHTQQSRSCIVTLCQINILLNFQDICKRLLNFHEILAKFAGRLGATGLSGPGWVASPPRCERRYNFPTAHSGDSATP